MTNRDLFRRILDVGLFAATIAAVALSFIEGLPEWGLMAVLILFVVMFFTRWWVAEDRRTWMKSNWFDLLLVVLLSSPLLRMLMALRIAHLLPALKIGALIRSNKERLLRLLVLSGESLPAAMATLFGLVFVFGAVTFSLEHGHNPQFGELSDALWWAFVTITTVGYGDIVPITAGGRVVAVMTMVFGIIIYSLLVANLTVFLNEYGRRQMKVSAIAVEDDAVDRESDQK
ncbi:voltage-gated potassium channel [Mariprofundus ferrinatatus]|uniref:Voltage-gated potassium channel n=1 Tax=Mariprofundus ferrinatatus TaxID=1921087 RepID=A0A2K8L551_9PROT|nr:potassium channel family protein [Mariprofundus ferrinatatus]ATX82440.1 voltage-gated potassium channel [Mariprofundus ferrinatatus]